MMRRRVARRCVLIVGTVALAFGPAGIAGAADDEPDLSSVTIEIGDLPEGFRLVSEDELVAVGGSAAEIGESLERTLEGSRLEQYRVYANASGEELVEVVVVGPLTATDRLGLELALRDPEEIADALTPFMMFVEQSTPTLVDAGGIGDIAVGFTVDRVVTSELAVVTNLLGVEWRESTFGLLLALREDYILIVATNHVGTGEPQVDLVTMARTVDARFAVALGGTATGTYRPSGTFSPELVTHIPALGDISTDPDVMIANLVLAAVAVLILTVATRVLNTTLARHEHALEKMLLPARTLARWFEAADAVVRRLVGKGADVVRVCGILLFYGVLFSFLEAGWRPWTVSGLFLLAMMTVAYGAVGTGDDLVEFHSARKRNLPSRLIVKPALVMLAVGSVVVSRIGGLVPGLLIGTPEAFTLESEIPKADRFHLSTVALGSMAAIGIGSWVIATPLDAAVEGSSGFLHGVLAGSVTLLLLVFAVALENLFANMLGFPGSEGESLRDHSRALWWTCMVLVTGLFFHTLINPSGDLADALESTNVLVVMATVAAFLIGTILVWWWFHSHDRRSSGPMTDMNPEASG